MRFLLLIIPLFFVLPPAYAETSEEQARSRLESLLSRLTSLEGNFIQYEYDASGAPLRTLRGNFKMQRPLKLAWHITDPYTQRITSNGSHLSIYDKELKQLIIRPLNTANLPPFFLLNDAGFKEMRISIIEQDAFLLEAVQATNWNEIYLVFKDDLPAETHWQDTSGQRVVLLLEKLRANRPIGERSFRYNPPPRTTIVRQE